MGLNISPDVLQGQMTELFGDSAHVQVYMDDILTFTKGRFEQHLKEVEDALDRLQSNNMAVNALKSYLAVEEVDYLGFRLTKQAVLFQPRKLKAIQDMACPKNKKEP